MGKKIAYPADTVDSNGKVWDTVGENIRNGGKNAEAILKAIYGEDAKIVEVDINVPLSGPAKTSNSDIVSANNTIHSATKNIVGYFIKNITNLSGTASYSSFSFGLSGTSKYTYLSVKDTSSTNIGYDATIILVLK